MEVLILELFVKLDYRCNNKCVFCSTGKKDGFLGNDEVNSLIENIDINKFDTVTISGGEVTLRKDFLDIMKRLKEKGLKIRLQTNARTMKDLKFAEELSEIGVENYLISFHNDDPRIFEEITQVPGSFSETVEGITNLIKCNQNITTNTVVSNINYTNLKDIAKKLCDIGVNTIKFVFVRGFGRAEDDYSNFCPRFTEVSPYLNKAIKYILSLNRNVMTEGIPFCILPENYNVAGELYIPENIDYKDFQHDQPDFTEYEHIYHNKGADCHKCNFNSLCKGPWKEYIELYGTGEFIPIVDTDPLDVIPLELLTCKLFQMEEVAK